ncbi:MAG: BTAD domain-containing putative transcriptional regulator, partial [Acidimicrobiia bacterium]
AALEPDREKRTEGTILLTRSPGYVISVDPADLDATRFEQLALEGRALLDADPGAASLVLSEALALWRGHAFEEFTYESFAQPEIARLEELRLITVEDRVDADLSVGRSRELVGELESLVRQHPLRERLTGHLMVALHRSGRQGEALRAFGALQTRLGEELGLEPSAEITKLEERIVLDDPTLRQAKAALVAGGRPEPGLSVRGYELREKIGEGALGYVYRAYQPAVGREVAIKVIRPELANNPDFIRRFEAEAQLVARLEHPQIVPLFDYWREPDSAFLVMRMFERGSLQDALDAGPLSTEGAARVIEQLGAALSTAHHRGVTHGDIKPANVMIDGDGNAYLADFGMSLDYGAAGGSPSSLVAPYASPEQRASGEVTSLSDLYSLGVVADHALRGATGEGKRPDSPLVGPAADVIARATAERPGDRFPDVESFVEELGVALGGTALVETTALLDAENPYRGLRPFEEGDASRFFGRERLIERLVARLGHPGPQGRMVTFVGPSGAGKSSVVRAGLIPALRQGALPGSDRWFIITMTPGSHPCEALEDALLKVAVDPPSGLLEELMSNGIPAVVQSLLPEAGSQLLLIVDQLEELFTHASPQDARTFLTAVADAASDRHSSVKVVTTLRADFYDHPLRHEAFGELVRLGTEVITPMTAEELERAVAAPAAEVGVSYETGLVAQIVSDMAGQSAALPLMQYSLTELFEQRTGATISTESYRALGGISATLVRRADSLYEALDADAKTSTREVFLRLVTLGEGSEDTRRRALQSELTDGGGDGAVSVLDTFGRHRLLSFDRDPVTRAPTVEIAHEALLTEWSRLSQWIEDARTDVLAQRRLAASAADWRERHNNPDFLLTGARYSRYGGWSENPPVRLTEAEGQFLAASREAAATEVQTERRRVRRLRRLVVGVGVAFVLALVAGVVAGVQRNTAEQQTRLAVGRELAGSALAAIDDDPQLSILLALEAAATTEPDGVILREAVEAMHAAVLASRIEWVADLGSAGSSIGARFSPDGSRIAAGSTDGPIRIFDATTGVVMATLIGHEGEVPDVRWLPDGNLVSIGHEFLGDGTVRLWDGDSGELLETWTGVDPVNLDVSPDGSLVATSTVFNGEIKVLNRRTGEVRTIATVPFPVGIAFDPVDGSRLAVASAV